ncbi:MAG: cell envelope integrity protein CreD [Deltaproteobacteria bacterium]|nr:cell envelope integrity protein CreD [Deltaproteobacteria bacterium]
MQGRFAVLLKVLFIGFMTLVMLIPTLFIMNLVNERQARRQEATDEIMKGWGGQQTLSGPVLVVPFLVQSMIVNEKGEKTARNELHYSYFLPDKLQVQSNLESQTLYRGIFKVPVYQGKVEIEGRFVKPDLTPWNIAAENIYWDRAFLTMGVSDLRGLRETPQVQWNQAQVSFEPGTKQASPFDSAIQAKLPPLDGTTTAYNFKMTLHLGGGQHLAFLPLGKDTQVKLSSNWPHPSFTGNFLPINRSVDERGFQAEWKIPETARAIPQSWIDSSSELYLPNFAFGADFMLPVDIYQFTTRAAKYAMLFILLTFVAFFLFEIMSKLRIHPVQYLLVSAGLCVFYLLLLSLSEHIAFAWAYIAATAGTVGLITAYLMTVLQKKSRALLMATVLTGLYGYLFTLLRAEDYALLMGSAGLFVILAAVMFLTRKINWYDIDQNKNIVPEAAPVVA